MNIGHEVNCPLLCQERLGKTMLFQFQICNWVNENHEEYEEMYLWAVSRLKTAGLIQYEVSNFSKKGKEN